MAKSIRIALPGASGRMGRMITRAIAATDGFGLAAASDLPDSPHVGEDAGTINGLDAVGVLVAGSADALIAAKPDVLVDFTAAEASTAHAELAAGAGIPVVVGTTGHDDAQAERLRRAAGKCAIAWCANTSAGVAMLAGLVRQAAEALGEDWDIEIAETHHRHKVDAPSGTALALGEAAAKGRGVDLDAVADHARHGITGPRGDGRIGFSVTRGGDIVGEHSVVLFGAGERLELTHKATDRMIYARGALRAARWLVGRKPGLYSMKDVLAG